MTYPRGYGPRFDRYKWTVLPVVVIGVIIAICLFLSREEIMKSSKIIADDPSILVIGLLVPVIVYIPITLLRAFLYNKFGSHKEQHVTRPKNSKMFDEREVILLVTGFFFFLLSFLYTIQLNLGPKGPLNNAFVLLTISGLSPAVIFLLIALFFSSMAIFSMIRSRSTKALPSDDYRGWFEKHSEKLVKILMIAVVIINFSVFFIYIDGPESISGSKKQEQRFIDLVNSGNTFYSDGNYQYAVAMYDTALEIHPNDTYVLQKKGNAFHSLSRYEDAIKWYDKALDIKPGNQFILNDRSAALSQLNLSNQSTNLLR